MKHKLGLGLLILLIMIGGATTRAIYESEVIPNVIFDDMEK